MAVSEDVKTAASWILDRMEQDQNERRQWHEHRLALVDEDKVRLAEWDKSSRGGVKTLTKWVVVRSIIEVLILVVLIVKL